MDNVWCLFEVVDTGFPDGVNDTLKYNDFQYPCKDKSAARLYLGQYGRVSEYSSDSMLFVSDEDANMIAYASIERVRGD